MRMTTEGERAQIVCRSLNKKDKFKEFFRSFDKKVHHDIKSHEKPINQKALMKLLHNEEIPAAEESSLCLLLDSRVSNNFLNHSNFSSASHSMKYTDSQIHTSKDYIAEEVVEESFGSSEDENE